VDLSKVPNSVMPKGVEHPWPPSSGCPTKCAEFSDAERR